MPATLALKSNEEAGASLGMPRVFLSLGSNVDPEANLRLGVAELARSYGELDVSPIYENKAVGFVGDDFLNLVVGLNTNDSIADIAGRIEAIHGLAGRDRSQARYSSRTLDIDLLTWGNTVTDAAPLKLPRDDILKYAFVLKPLADLAGGERHPETGQTYASHWVDMSGRPHDLRRVELELLPQDERPNSEPGSR